MNLHRIGPAANVRAALVAPSAPARASGAGCGKNVDFFARTGIRNEILIRSSAPESTIDRRLLATTLSPSLLGILAGVPLQLVSPGLLSLLAALEIEQDATIRQSLD